MGLRLTNNAGGNGRLRLTNSLGTNGRVRIWLSQSSSNDPDAQAFIIAAGITDPTQQSAINTLVLDLKSFSIWTKFNAIYPFVGGTATTHKFNLKNPLDTDAAFRLTFSGGFTHSATGITPNGTNGWAETYFNPALNFGAIDGNGHISYYSRTNNNGNYVEMMVYSGTNQVELSIRYAGSSYYAINNLEVSVTNPTSLGYYIANRTNSTTLNIWRNNVKTQVTNNFSSRPNGTLALFANKQIPSTIAQYTNRQCAFATIGNGLNDTEAGNLYTIVQAFQTTLSRQV
jgi:hypothetical protein